MRLAVISIFVTVIAIALALPSIPINSIVPRDIELQAQENECRPTTLLWIARIAAPGIYENHFIFTVRDFYHYNFPWERDYEGPQTKVSEPNQLGHFVRIHHSNLTTTLGRMFIDWMGQRYFRPKADWEGYMVGAPVRPAAHQYWYCLPLVPGVRFTDEWPYNGNPGPAVQ
ncbi:hypothetical protein BGZ96_011637 [Linnemannia gamsii]|uniref:Uncharacterized protein n=1 Tax=Linnemannia gamsii TaxID=64522 RepID=A0ABQ7JS90_9FUNG|nr:hypothetical protein BGZ96_011637 [Linnemannia gamsii]